MKDFIKKLMRGLMLFSMLLAAAGIVSFGSGIIAVADSYGGDDGDLPTDREYWEKEMESIGLRDYIYVEYEPSGNCDEDCNCNDGSVKKKTMSKKKFLETLPEMKKLKYVSFEPSEPVVNEKNNNDTETVQDKDTEESSKETTDADEKQATEDTKVSDAVQDDHAPKNVEVTFTGTETDGDGQKWLVVEVSWDADSGIHYNEIYPLLLDPATGGAYIIPSSAGQTIGNAPDVPEAVRYTTENGRNKYTLRVAVINSGEAQIGNSEAGTFAYGVREGDTLGIMMTSVTDPQNWTESAPCEIIEAKYTEEAVAQKKTFK